jgi:hypothetical protein
MTLKNMITGTVGPTSLEASITGHINEIIPQAPMEQPEYKASQN